MHLEQHVDYIKSTCRANMEPSCEKTLTEFVCNSVLKL